MTDVTGFGLARHGLSLLASLGDDPESTPPRHSTASLVLDLDQLPILSPALSLAEDGVASSLFHANQQAAPIAGATHSAHPALPLIYDPQTGGGLLAIVPKAKAQAICSDLRSAQLDAALIGHISLDGLAQIRVE